MKRAADFRRIARSALSGKWFMAALTCFVATLIGAGIFSYISIQSTYNGGSFSLPDFSEIDVSDPSVLITTLVTMAIVIVVVLVVVFAICAVIFLFTMSIYLLLGGPGKLGYARYNLNLVDRNNARFSDLFSQFGRFRDGFLLNLLTYIYLWLWSLLIIPGIIKTYSYAMTPYILYEHPELSANQAITESRRMMNGNKWRLFCLNFSFIGWHLLCVLPTLALVFIMILLFVLLAIISAFIPIAAILFIPLVIIMIALLVLDSLVSTVGIVFVNTYKEAACAAFYREITKFDCEYAVPDLSYFE